MTNIPGIRVVLDKPFGAVMVFAVLLTLFGAITDGIRLLSTYGGMGNDDIMRLLTVRDWIAGQGWYDVMQYRLLPPDGVELHWSRYIDVGIAVIIVPLSWFFPMETAEMLAATIWPTLILILTILAIGFGTRRIFGKSAACFAVMCVALWPLTASLHNSAGDLDHHNVQLLMMVLLSFAVIWPSRPMAAGIVGGVAASFSLAIGLESLPFIVGAGITLLMRALFLATPVSQKLLTVFCVSLGVASVVFWLGQTPPVRWTQTVCDQLGLPTLSLVAMAIVGCLVPFAAARWLQAPLSKLAVTVFLIIVGLALAWPMLSVCLAGPYGELPVALQETISSGITEALPGLVYAKANLVAALIFTLPVFVALFGGFWLWVSTRQGHSQTAYRNQALGLLLILGALGTAMIFVQMRTVIMVASVAPIVGGVLAAYFLDGYLKNRDLTKGLMAIAIAAIITSPTMIIGPLAPILEPDDGTPKHSDANCRSFSSMRTLNEVPPSVILTHLNFGPTLIWATHHAGLSAPYHRSAEALGNGVFPFGLVEAEMVAYLRDVGATHLLLCEGYNYAGDFADDLASGGQSDWLRPVPVTGEGQLLFAVLPE